MVLPPGAESTISRLPARRAAASTSSLTSVTSNSGSAASSSRGLGQPPRDPPRSRCPGRPAAAPAPPTTAAEEHEQRLGIGRAPAGRPAGRSQHAGGPRPGARSTGRRGRAVAVARANSAHSSSSPAATCSSNSASVDEVVVDARRSPGPRRPGGRRDRQPRPRGARRSSLATTVPLPTPAGRRGRSARLAGPALVPPTWSSAVPAVLAAELGEQGAMLLGAETADPAGRRRSRARSMICGRGPCRRPGMRLEHGGDLHLADHLVGVVLQDLGQAVCRS